MPICSAYEYHTACQIFAEAQIAGACAVVLALLALGVVVVALRWQVWRVQRGLLLVSVGLPLSLAVVAGLVAGAASESYAIHSGISTHHRFPATTFFAWQASARAEVAQLLPLVVALVVVTLVTGWALLALLRSLRPETLDRSRATAQAGRSTV